MMRISVHRFLAKGHRFFDETAKTFMKQIRCLSTVLLLVVCVGVCKAQQLSTPQALLENLEIAILSNKDQANVLLEKALGDQTILNSDGLRSRLENALAHRALLNGNLDVASVHLQNAENLARSGNVPFQLAESFRRQGILFLFFEQHAAALELFNKALIIHTEIESNKKATTLESLANLYMHINDHEQVEKYALFLLRDAENENLLALIPSAHFYLVQSYIGQNKLELADLHLQKLFDTKQSKLDSVLAFMSQGNLDTAMGLFESALASLEQSKILASELEYLVAIPKIKMGIIDVYKSSNEYEKALEELHALLQFSFEQGYIQYQLNTLKDLSSIYELQGNLVQALKTSREHDELLLSVTEKRNQQLSLINQAKYDTNIKDAQIQALELQNQLNKNHDRFKTAAIIIALITIVLLSFFLFIVYKQKRILNTTYLQLQEASNAKSQFLARMSHEIRTPINAIIGLTKLSLKASTDKEQQLNLKQIEDSSQLLLGVVNDVLDFSKIEAAKLSINEVSFDLFEVVNLSINMNKVKAMSKNIKLSKEISSDVPQMVKGDPLRLQQVLTNLLSNAVKFTEKGNVLLTIKRLNDDEPNTLEFKIKDTGIGIDLQKTPNIFESFSQADESITRKFGGTGLGLAICKQIVDLMAGNIRVESELGQGTTVTFTVAFENAANDPDPNFHNTATRVSKVILIDDCRTTRESIKSAMSELNIDCVTTNNGYDGITQIRNAYKSNTPFDLIIIDWKMPDIDGIEVASVIRNEFIENAPNIVMLTGHDLNQLKPLGDSLGIHLYLQKPVSPSALKQLIINALSHEDDSSPSVKSSYVSIPNLEGYCVLIVEDNSLNKKVATAYLEPTGANLLFAENGKVALTLLANNENIDLVLMDIQMPEMDGFTATKKIRNELNLDVPIIAMSAHVMTEEVNKCKALGMNGHVAKPIDASKLYSSIVELEITNKNTKAEKTAQATYSKNSSTNLAKLSQLKINELSEIDKPRALATLFEDSAIYEDLVNDFLQLYYTCEISLPIKQAQELENIKKTIHALKPSLSYIGAFKLAKFSFELETELKMTKLPLESDLQTKLVLFTNALSTVKAHLTVD